MLRVVQAENEWEIEEAQTLFREYERWLDMDLCFQGFEQELLSLPGRYAVPDGRLYLAYSAGELAGCVAMRKMEDGLCEMKRLYVRGGFRGLGIGRKLVENLISEARAIGYRRMLLDTYPPKMGIAVSIYESHGFRPVAPYYHNPHEGVLFMQLDLDAKMPSR